MKIPIVGTDYHVLIHEPYTESNKNVGWYIELTESIHHPFLTHDSIIIYTARPFGFVYTTSHTYYIEYRNGILLMEE